MTLSPEYIISAIAALATLALFIFVVDWRYFRDWIVVFLFKCTLDFAWGSPVVQLGLLEYPVRLLPRYYETCLLFEIWVFPVLCILYNQVTRTRGLGPIIGYAVLFSAGLTAIEYPIELTTKLITYHGWTWCSTFSTLTVTFLMSRTFIAFFRWGCDHFGRPDR